MKDVYLKAIQLNPGVERVYAYFHKYYLDDWMNDSKTFIYTIKNRYGPIPSQFLMKDGSETMNYCAWYGPRFGHNDIYIDYDYNKHYTNYICCRATFKCEENSWFIGSSGSSDHTFLKYQIMRYLVSIMRKEITLISCESALMSYGNI